VKFVSLFFLVVFRVSIFSHEGPNQSFNDKNFVRQWIPRALVEMIVKKLLFASRKIEQETILFSFFET